MPLFSRSAHRVPAQAAAGLDGSDDLGPARTGRAADAAADWSHDFSAVPLVQRQCSGSGKHSSTASNDQEESCQACGPCGSQSPQLQARLQTSAPGDRWEHEADRAADAVMAGTRVPALATVTRGASAATACAPGDRVVSASSGNAATAAAAPSPHARLDASIPARVIVPAQQSPAESSAAEVEQLLRAPGRPLDAATRHLMESRFRVDFGAVRIHDDGRASRSAQSLQARAYTVGRHVAFNHGEFAPHTAAGQRLLAHELAHVVQQQGSAAAAMPTLMRSACDAPRWDGQPPGCGAGGLRASWRLVDIATSVAEDFALDELIVTRGLAHHFPGDWITQVWTPPNPVKGGIDRGRADGMKISFGATLRAEVVEVKSRSTQFAGGCALAAREAAGYVQVLRPLAPQIVQLSAALAGMGGMRADPNRLTATQQFVLQSSGISMADPGMRDAWRFYQSVQNRLNTTFTTAFTAFEAAVNADGTRSTVYRAGPPVIVECTVGRGRSARQGVKRRQLGFQVNTLGGVSYGCSDTPCESREEEEKRQQQQLPMQPAVPVTGADTQEQGQEQDRQREAARVPARPPRRDDDLTVPVLVGAGGAALGAAAIAAARRRALRIAGERAAALASQRLAVALAERAAAANVINLAERRAAAAAAKAAGGRVAGQVVGRAAAYASAAALVFLLASGRAEARVGPGPSPLEALYDSLTRNGTPPSPELRALIDSDPALREVAERAGASGDMTPLQEALTRRLMELVRDNPGQFSAVDLELLTQASNGAGSGASPQTAAELRAAIERARAGRSSSSGSGAAGRGSGAAAGPDGGANNATGGSADTGNAGTGSASGGAAPAGGVASGTAPLAQAVADVDRDFPGLSPASRGRLAAAPAPLRRLFDAMTAPGGAGPVVDDAVVQRFLEVVPIDLDDARAQALIAGLGPVTGQTAEQILARLQTAIRTQAAGSGASPQVPPRAGDAGSLDAIDQPPAARASPTPGAAPSGSGMAADSQPDEAERAHTVALLRAAIDGFDGWAVLNANQRILRGNLTGSAVGSEVGLYLYERVAMTDGGSLRVSAFLQVRVTQAASRTGQRWSGVVVGSTVIVAEDGQVVDGLPAGTRVGGVLQ